jgi:large subunit ribosomal protein L4e
MKSVVYAPNGEKTKRIDLPPIFSLFVREDIIKKCFLIGRSNSRQVYGASMEAGKRHAVKSWRPGRGVSRVPRLTGGSRAAFAPQTVSGRRAHPPKVEKVWKRKINKKEKFKALCSAFSATADVNFVSRRGHKFSENLNFPVVVENTFETLERTKDVVESLIALGVYDDVLRSFKGRKLKRGRGYRMPRSVLILCGENARILQSARNIIGVDVRTLRDLKISDIAPGGVPGRLTLYSESVIKELRGWCE